MSRSGRPNFQFVNASDDISEERAAQLCTQGFVREIHAGLDTKISISIGVQVVDGCGTVSEGNLRSVSALIGFLQVFTRTDWPNPLYEIQGRNYEGRLSTTVSTEPAVGPIGGHSRYNSDPSHVVFPCTYHRASSIFLVDTNTTRSCPFAIPGALRKYPSRVYPEVIPVVD